MSELVRLSLSIEQPLYEQLETLVSEGGYTNRSEFVRDLIRNQLVTEEWEGNEEALGTISLLFDHHARGLGARLTHHQHHFTGALAYLVKTCQQGVDFGFTAIEFLRNPKPV